MFSNLKKGLVATTMLAGATCVAQTASAGDMVALLLPENVNPRWEQQDGAAFVSTMAEIAPGVKVEVFNANNDTSVQQRQAEQALTQGAQVLVVVPIDGESSAIIADSAAEEGIPTIAYDRMINSPNTKIWVQADMFATGAAQAQHVVDNTSDGDTLGTGSKGLRQIQTQPLSTPGRFPSLSPFSRQEPVSWAMRTGRPVGTRPLRAGLWIRL